MGAVVYPPGTTVPTWRFSEHNVEAELLNALMNSPDEDDVSGLFRPLDGIVKLSNRVVDGLAVSHEYYIQIVPTVLELYAIIPQDEMLEELILLLQP